MTEPITHPNKFFIESRRLSNLPTGCISDESEDSDNEICDDNSYPEIPPDVDNKLLSVDAFRRFQCIIKITIVHDKRSFYFFFYSSRFR